MADDTKRFPRGKVSIGGGELRDCFDATFTATRSAKVQHVLAKDTPAGISLGPKSGTWSLQIAVREDGSAEDWLADYNAGTSLSLRFKDPTTVHQFGGVVNQVVLAYKLEEAIVYTVSGVGWLK